MRNPRHGVRHLQLELRIAFHGGLGLYILAADLKGRVARGIHGVQAANLEIDSHLISACSKFFPTMFNIGFEGVDKSTDSEVICGLAWETSGSTAVGCEWRWPLRAMSNNKGGKGRQADGGYGLEGQTLSCASGTSKCQVLLTAGGESPP